MNKIQKHNGNQAKLCSSNNCITVYGETAELINFITVAFALIIGLSLMAKVLR